jgi:hypothetical protein
MADRLHQEEGLTPLTGVDFFLGNDPHPPCPPPAEEEGGGIFFRGRRILK